ncbi:MAG: leucyl aminopeptidase [Cellvibrionales bacterium TMED148]|nr:leucyl aminopeptidase [Porticoccaceae bacterium]RPG89836.1 MAG: leucyl aminopeptidase [Cellvibrionales bacterium TMED148]
MDFKATSANPLKLKIDCLIVLTDARLSHNHSGADEALLEQLRGLVKAIKFDGKNGSVQSIYTPTMPFKQIILVGIDGAITNQKKLGCVTAAANQAIKTSAKKLLWIETSESEDLAWQSCAMARSLVQASYKYAKGKKIDPIALNTIFYWTPQKSQLEIINSGLYFGASVGKGVNRSRALGNLPANICTPTYLAQTAREMATACSKLSSKIINEVEMKKLGMGALLSVTAGTKEPAKFIVMEYCGADSTEPPVVLIGKAVTFDSGGISIKPSGGMDEMKFDMCGGAAVFGVMDALISSELAVNVVGLVPAVENMPSGSATKPGDVVTSMSGQTIEVLNTDAEGRLILCDAITFAERFKPKAVIDVATLTGACVLALGKHASGLMTNDQTLGQTIEDCGTRCGDRVWMLPLWEEYDRQLKSNFADMANIGGREAGAITAGCFLARFAKKLRWAHIDIAGTAWMSGKQKAATGRPVPLLMDFLSNCKA